VINRRAKDSGATTLYDAGGWFLIAIFAGVAVAVVGVVLDYFWNFLILILSLRWLHISVSYPRKFIYCLIVTAIGLLIDWLYYELTWGRLVVGNLRVEPLFEHAGLQPALECTTILIPMIVVGLVNFGAAHLLLRMSLKQAAILGAIMGVFTAPWLITVLVVFTDII
jgi:hypothetical protein